MSVVKLTVWGCVVCVLLVAGSVGGCMYVKPKYTVYQQRMEGAAELARAESNRTIRVEEAKANQQAMEYQEKTELTRAKYQAEMEVTRARGVAEANVIIGDSLKGNEAYLRWLWIEGLKDAGNRVIYIPTEAGLPILEAGKR